jgi:acetyl-CoA carboxylase carboxyltransferase component
LLARPERTARENVEGLVDPGSLVEYGGFAIAAQRGRREVEELLRTPADGLIGRMARVNGELFGAGRLRGPLLRLHGAGRHPGAVLRVPLIAVVLRRGYGLGAQAMADGSLHEPLLTVAWPGAHLGPMGLEGAVRPALRKELEEIADEAERASSASATSRPPATLTAASPHTASSAPGEAHRSPLVNQRATSGERGAGQAMSRTAAPRKAPARRSTRAWFASASG